MNEQILKLKEAVYSSRRIVFFGGAGVSTESGIPDFRSVDGLYNQKYAYPPERILSRTFFDERTKEFYDFYKDKMIFLDAKPNAAHYAVAKLEREGRLSAVVTQNIDGLHQKAGSKNVYELHGSTLRNYCVKCGKFFDISAIVRAEGVPKCDCGGIIKPDVVLYEEPLNDDTVRSALKAISEADTLIVAGTSLSVYPAAGFVEYFRGKTLAIINKSSTHLDSRADVCINGKVGEVLSEVVPL